MTAISSTATLQYSIKLICIRFSKWEAINSGFIFIRGGLPLRLLAGRILTSIFSFSPFGFSFITFEYSLGMLLKAWEMVFLPLMGSGRGDALMPHTFNNDFISEQDFNTPITCPISSACAVEFPDASHDSGLLILI